MLHEAASGVSALYEWWFLSLFKTELDTFPNKPSLYLVISHDWAIMHHTKGLVEVVFDVFMIRSSWLTNEKSSPKSLFV